nr:hypothetical protein [Tanacetum cinerariifolium]
MNMSKHLKGRGGSSLRSRTPRPSKHFFPSCIHCRIISLRRGIKPQNPQHVMKICKIYGNTIHTTTDHNDIEWFRRGEALQAKKAEALKSTKAESSNANRSKTPTKRYPPDAYLHPYEPSQMCQTNSNDVSFKEPYESLEPVFLETEVSSDQNGQANQNDQNDQSAQSDEIINDDQSELSHYTNDEQIIEHVPNTKDIQISEHLSSPNAEDTLVHDIIPIPNPSLSIPSMVSPTPQYKCFQDKHIELAD